MVWLYHNTINEKAYQLLACCEVRAVETGTNLLDEFRKLLADGSAHAVIMQGSGCVVLGVHQRSPAFVQVLASLNQVFEVNGIPLVGVQ